MTVLRSRLFVAIACAFLLALGITPAAHAEELDSRIVHALEAEPGGVVTSTTTVEWPTLGMRLTLTSNGFSRGLSTRCPSGLVCAFQGAGEAGARLTWASCGTFSTAALTTVGSVANGRSTGTVQARNGSTVLASASAGNFANTPSGVTNVRCI